MLDDEARYRVLESRDARFDGVFYAGVTTTGIYCRPSCPARTPLRRNVRFFRSAAKAQSAGLRACRRCRPDVVPGAPEWSTRADLAARAVRLVADGVVERDGVDGLAHRLGYSVRQVHRTLVDELGVGPLRLARAQRAHTARTLLETTPMTITEIAYAAGFASIRQFNDTMREVYASTPTELRAAHVRRARGQPAGHREADGETGRVELRLAYRSPAALDDLWAFLEARAVPGIEEVVGGTYRRTLLLPRGAAIVELTPGAEAVTATLHLRHPGDLTAAAARCRRLLDLDADPVAVDAGLGADPTLAPFVAALPGMRVPGAVDPTEMAVRAVLGQQVSVGAARTLAARVVQAYGQPLPAPNGSLTHTFPTADALAAADPASFHVTTRRAATLHALTQGLADGTVNLDAGADRDVAEQQLLGLPGIGPWTAHYLRMRALSDPDVFLPTDLAIRAGAARLGLPTDPRALDAVAQRWRPWRSYALRHVWRASIGPVG